MCMTYIIKAKHSILYLGTKKKILHLPTSLVLFVCFDLNLSWFSAVYHMVLLI